MEKNIPKGNFFNKHRRISSKATAYNIGVREILCSATSSVRTNSEPSPRHCSSYQKAAAFNSAEACSEKITFKAKDLFFL